MILSLALSLVAFAQVDPRCEHLEKPTDYDEQVQQDFLANYVALATTLSPTHGPIPHAPGRGAIGFDVGVIPPLGCDKRFVLEHMKTEDTNKTPAAPRARLSFAFPAIGPVVPYAGLAYLPPITVFGTRNVILSGEVGAGVQLGETWQVGGRYHHTTQKTIADIATAFDDEYPPVGDPIDDMYLASTFGFDLMVGKQIPDLFTPYAAIGVTDVSTFFYVGDDGLISNNRHPYAGLTFSVGVDGLVKDRLRWGAEFYGAPGGHWGAAAVAIPKADYGSLYTGRFRLGFEL